MDGAAREPVYWRWMAPTRGMRGWCHSHSMHRHRIDSPASGTLVPNRGTTRRTPRVRRSSSSSRRTLMTPEQQATIDGVRAAIATRDAELVREYRNVTGRLLDIEQSVASLKDASGGDGQRRALGFGAGRHPLQSDAVRAR